VLELTELIWRKINGTDKGFRYVSDPPYPYDVQERSPSVEKAQRLPGFEATTPLGEVLDEVIAWVSEEMKVGRI
jgi:nucleoside-diphosphate-sugar epimerase